MQKTGVFARFRWVQCQKWLKNSNRIMSVVAVVLFVAFVIAVVVVKTIEAQESTATGNDVNLLENYQTR